MRARPSINGVQVMAPMRRGTMGTNALNARLAAELNAAGGGSGGDAGGRCVRRKGWSGGGGTSRVGGGGGVVSADGPARCFPATG